MSPTEALARAASHAVQAWHQVSWRADAEPTGIDDLHTAIGELAEALDGYEVRRCAIRNRRYGPCTLAKGHDGLHQWSSIEQAAEAADREAAGRAGVDSRSPDEGAARTSAAADPIKCPFCGELFGRPGLDVEALAALGRAVIAYEEGTRVAVHETGDLDSVLHLWREVIRLAHEALDIPADSLALPAAAKAAK